MYFRHISADTGVQLKV